MFGNQDAFKTLSLFRVSHRLICSDCIKVRARAEQTKPTALVIRVINNQDVYAFLRTVSRLAAIFEDR